MALAAWIALVFMVVAVAGSAVVLVLRGLRAWRTLRGFTRATADGVEQVLETAATAEKRALALTEGTTRLNEATAHLQESLAQLALIRAAADEARARVTSFRGAVPRK